MKSGFELSAWPFVPFGFGCPGNGCDNTSHRSQSSVLGSLSREYLYIHIHAHTEHVGLYLLISTYPVRPLRNKRDKCVYVYNIYLRVYIIVCVLCLVIYRGSANDGFGGSSVEMQGGQKNETQRTLSFH